MIKRSGFRKKALVFAGAFLLGGTAISAAAAVNGKDTFQPADTGHRTYVLSDLGIEHPYEGSDVLAAVGYTANWSSEDYPGVAQCRVTLTDERGAVVGQADFTLDSASAEFTRPVGEVVEVTSEPVNGRGQCAQGNYNPNASRTRFEAHSMSRSPSSSVPGQGNAHARVTFDLNWPGEGGQFMRTCRVVVKFTDGTQAGGEPFATNRGDGPASYDVFMEGHDQDDIESATLVCDELKS